MLQWRRHGGARWGHGPIILRVGHTTRWGLLFACHKILPRFLLFSSILLSNFNNSGKLRFFAKPPVAPQQSVSTNDSSFHSAAKACQSRALHTTDFLRVDGVSDISHNLSEPPSQPILQEYPKRVFGARSRCFNKEWYKGRDWLEYSISSDSAFCYYCRAFSNNTTSDQWIIYGFKNWKGAMEENKGFKSHEASEAHIEAFVKWCSFQESVRSGSIITKCRESRDRTS